jgi:tight adherence protein C
MLYAVIVASACLAFYFGINVLMEHLANRSSGHLWRATLRLRELGGETALESPEGDEQGGWLRQVVSQVGGWVMPRTGKRTVGLHSRLDFAGYRHPSAGLYFAGIRLVLIVGLALTLGLVAGVARTTVPLIVMGATVGGGVGFIAPSLVLVSQVKKRQRVIRNALPDALDILVLSVEGGVSLNAAIIYVTDEIKTVHPILGAELDVVQKEMQLGLSAGEAFRAFADRCGITEVRDLAAALVQSERYGASIAKALRAYADSARENRQLWAEEVAQKAAVKILFPMLLCIFPAIFIVLLGPAAMQMSRLFAR